MRTAEVPRGVRLGDGTFLGASCIALFALMTACSSKESGSGSDGVSAGGSGGSGGAGGTGETVIFAEDAGDPSPITEDCVEEVSRAETIPVDIYIMFDQSGSMLTPAGAGTRMDAVRAALADFLNERATYGIGVGIGYFGHLPIGQTSCDPADYSTPAVEIAALPGAADALVASLNGVEPTGETPTGAAIRGACTYARTHAQANPTRYVINLLVTDGVPEAPVSSLAADGAGCNPTLEDAVAATLDCSSAEPNVDTYVLGVGPSLGNLNQIAVAGNTNAAYLVEGDDVAAQVLLALSEIRGTATIPCEFAIPTPPEGQDLDYDTVNVEFTADDGGKKQLYNVPDATYCGPEGGWYYDEGRTRILLCADTCYEVTGSTYGQVDYTLGCEETRVIR